MNCAALTGELFAQRAKREPVNAGEQATIAPFRSRRMNR